MYSFSITLSEGHTVSVTNDGNMTEVKNEIKNPGQQSVSGSSFNTGPLVSPPKYVKSEDSLLIVLESASERYQVQIKGGNMSTGQFALDADDLDDMPSTSS
jgi:hypothetical protein